MFAFSARKQPNAITKDNRNYRDGDIVDQTSGKKLTDYLPSVNIYPLRTPESARQFQHGARIELLPVVHFRRTMRHHDYALANVGPLIVFEDGVVGPSADHDRIHAGHECSVPMRFINGMNDRQPIDTAIGAGDVAIETNGNENGEARAHVGIPSTDATCYVDFGWAATCLNSATYRGTIGTL